MKFSEIVEQASALVQRKGRITYRALQLEFDLDAEHLAVLTEELVFTQPQIVDEAGRGLVWVGEERLESSVQSPESKQVQSLS